MTHGGTDVVSRTERLVTDEIPASVEEFLSHLTKQLTIRRHHHRLLTIVVFVGALAAVCVAVWAVVRVPTWSPDTVTPTDDGG